MTINQRIKLLMEHLGYNKHQFTQQLGIKSSSTIPNILNNFNRRPSYDIINRILTRFSNINARWLITGGGKEMFDRESDIPLINDRIIRIMEYYDLDKNAFIKRIDVNPEEVIPVIEKEKEPSSKFLRTIEACFTNINPQWPYHNQGRKMFKGRVSMEIEDQDGDIPYYDIEMADNKVTLANPMAIIKIHGFEDCNFSVSVWGSSMSPDYNTGEIILCRHSSKDMIMYGEAYLIFTEENILLRYVKMSDENNKVILAPPNNRYNSISISKDLILDLYLVRGRIIRSLL